MAAYHILTDSACDLPPQMLASLQVDAIPLHVSFRGRLRPDCVDDSIRELYAGWRNGETSTTSAVNPEGWRELMVPWLDKGEDVLAIAFSSGLSTTCQSASIAAAELREQYPERQIRVVDSLAASLGQGLLVWYACKKRDEGLSLDELTAWVEEYKFHLCHWFTVDDLMYLKRGGRISAATALVGTMLKIKPVLHMDDEGHLINVGKARGRKASLDALVDKAAELGKNYDNRTMFICHGDCIDDARYVEQQVKTRLGVQDVFIGYTGAVIGSHSGPGTLSLFFLGDHR